MFHLKDPETRKIERLHDFWRVSFAAKSFQVQIPSHVSDQLKSDSTQPPLSPDFGKIT